MKQSGRIVDMSEPRWLSETEMRAWSGFLETYELLDRHVDRQLREAGGVTKVQYEVLHQLNESPTGRLGMTDLAERMICSRSGLTYQVAQLEKTGLLRREADPTDERGVLAVLTDEGRRILHQAAPGHVRTVREGLIDLLTEEQVAQLADIMDTTRRHLRDIVRLPPPRKRKARSTP
jgi:DNA-binding MarR family transcriptional regulator